LIFALFLIDVTVESWEIWVFKNIWWRNWCALWNRDGSNTASLWFEFDFFLSIANWNRIWNWETGRRSLDDSGGAWNLNWVWLRNFNGVGWWWSISSRKTSNESVSNGSGDVSTGEGKISYDTS